MTMDETQEQTNNNKPWLFKKGQSGNPGGRPKGSISMKEYARRYLMELPEDEKIAFMEGLPKDIIWKMAEGNPKSEDSLLVGELPIPLDPDVHKDNGLQENTGTNKAA